ncbi:MAG TPA: hypothetical protein DCO79_06915 [Spirochaeta sp.]|nr:hypothetical protein [Spirochaeta sp.]
MKFYKYIFGGLLLISILFTGCSTLHEGNSFTKRVLFTGDSITEGELGCSYLQLIEEQFPDYELVNLGQDGDTLSGIMNRTIEHLQQDSSYDLIVIVAGHNDIILPDFARKTDTHRLIVDGMAKKGSVPAADFDEFISTYESLIDSVQRLVDTPIVVTTMSCLNEDLSASTNKQRAVYNRGIRTLAADKDIGLADVAAQFNSRLNELDCRDYFMDDLMHSALFGRMNSKTPERTDKLSRERKLHLTIDGIHLNSEGAKIYSSVLSAVLAEL